METFNWNTYKNTYLDNSAIEKEKKLGKWLEHKITNYNKEQYNMKNKEILNYWKKFSEEYKEYFFQ
tara:strand:- start:160 stop:357 length:198 start_codon:yes stop_codon:yes gene_type:complete